MSTADVEQKRELRCPVCLRWLTPPGDIIPPHGDCVASRWVIEADDWTEPVCRDCGGEGGFMIDGWDIACSTCDATGLQRPVL